MFTVDKIDNGYVLSTPRGQELYFKDEKTLIAGIRVFLGLPVQGRPKKVAEGVDNNPF